MFPCTATSLGSLEEELKGAERVIQSRAQEVAQPNSSFPCGRLYDRISRPCLMQTTLHRSELACLRPRSG
jgi:hypothetical protein